jgi:hypothetical protein
MNLGCKESLQMNIIFSVTASVRFSSLPRESESEEPMNEITRNLWIGDLPSAVDVQQLRKNKIYSVLSVMRGKLNINEVTISLHDLILFPIDSLID